MSPPTDLCIVEARLIRPTRPSADSGLKILLHQGPEHKIPGGGVPKRPIGAARASGLGTLWFGLVNGSSDFIPKIPSMPLLMAIWQKRASRVETLQAYSPGFSLRAMFTGSLARGHLVRGYLPRPSRGVKSRVLNQSRTASHGKRLHANPGRITPP